MAYNCYYCRSIPNSFKNQVLRLLKNRLPILLSACLFLSVSVNAQPPCGFDVIHQRLMTTDNNYAAQVNETNAAIRQFLNSHVINNPQAGRVTALYTIPVVVHVMHTGG